MGAFSSDQGLTLVHFSANRNMFCGIRWVVSWCCSDSNGSG